MQNVANHSALVRVAGQENAEELHVVVGSADSVDFNSIFTVFNPCLVILKTAQRLTSSWQRSLKAIPAMFGALVVMIGVK